MLIVDDEPFIAQSLLRIFRREGYTVRTAERGDEALAMIRSDPPALVFLDIMLPGGDGLQVCRAIREDPALREVRVVLLTALGRESDREAGFAAGADDYITKPFSPIRVLARARTLLESTPVGGA
ncbi:MAG: response regulator [Candidatus Eisenbacteria bacterium]|nr:response regulator [Candidatus Eisenbacteria bacterium]